MSGGDGSGPGNTGLGHNGGKPSGNVNGSSGNGGYSGNGGSTGGGSMRAPTASEVAGQYNSYGGSKISASQVSNIRSDGMGGYKADIKGADNNVSSGGPGNTSNTLGGFTGVSMSGHGNGNNNGGSGGKRGGTPTNPAWTSAPGHPGSYLASNNNAGLTSVDDNTKNNVNSYTLHFGSGATAVVTVPSGDRSKMKIEYKNWKGPKYDDGRVEKIVGSFLNFKTELEDNAVKDAISKVNDFYKELTSKYGDKLAKEARELADEAKGKTLRNSKEAIKAFDKYKDVLNKKFSVADREAIAKALESLDKEQMAKQLKIFGKAFGVAGEAIQWGGLIYDLAKGFRTGDWNDAIMSGEKIAAGKVASVMVTVAFSAMAVNPVGILGFAVIMAVTSALITDKRLEQLNNFIRDLK